MAKANDLPLTVNEGGTYTKNDGGDRVVAFFVDMGRVVRFSPEGRGTEDRLTVKEFLDQYTEVNTDKEIPKPVVNNADGTEKAA